MEQVLQTFRIHYSTCRATNNMITSPHNTKLKLIRALAGRPKERREAGAFLAEGVRLVEDAFAAQWPFEFALV